MRASKRLEPLLRLAVQQEKVRTIHLRNSQQQLQKYEEQFVCLEGYAVEYGAALQQENNQIITSKSWQLTKTFLTNLTVLLERQRRVIFEAKKVVELKRSEWQEAHQHYKTLSKLSLRYQANEKQALARQEQKQVDAISQQLLQWQALQRKDEE